MHMTPLKISEVIEELKAIKDRFGDLECHFDANGEDTPGKNLKPVYSVTIDNNKVVF